MNVRETAGINLKYSQLNREERNYAAIFFSALCKTGNAEKFLKYCGYNDSVGEDFGIYFEYAYLRDLWSKIKDEDIKKSIIQKYLMVSNIDEILCLPTKKINEYFGVAGEASSEFIQFPGKWAIVKYNNKFTENRDFLNVCKFKWSFNIKPDIVVHLDKDTAICIEAKYESSEGAYPSSETEKAIFKDRGIKYVGQMELQKYMMNDLLGIKTDFMFLVYKKESSSTHKVISWAEAFGCLDMNGMPAFAIEMAEKISS
jgi:hypothetical protein